MNLSARLGTVPYLNAAPLVYGLEDGNGSESLVRLPPAALADELAAGNLDAALVPIAEFLLHAEDYVLVEGAAIASRGPVYSVILAHNRPLHDIRSVALDPDSRTSVLLTRALLELGRGRRVDYYLPGLPADARLIIGDPAIAYRRDNPIRPVIDLGDLWQNWTGLPFVYAGWAIRRESATPELADRLRAAKRAGLAARPQIAADAEELHYLTEHIRYDLGSDEKAGLLQFAGYLVELGVLAKIPAITWI